VEAPDTKEREAILKVHTSNMPLSDEVSLKRIAQITEGYSGADLENVCREAGMQAIREKMNELETIEQKHFDFALSKINSTLPKEIIEKYMSIAKEITKSRNIQETKADLYR
jgi:transitional endoplasmic reticulum ATPase